MTDADLPVNAAIWPEDDEQDPRWEHFAGLSASRNRHRLLVQRIWHHRGSWSPSSWCLDLAVEVPGELVGIQALEADDSRNSVPAGLRRERRQPHRHAHRRVRAAALRLTRES